MNQTDMSSPCTHPNIKKGKDETWPTGESLNLCCTCGAYYLSFRQGKSEWINPEVDWKKDMRQAANERLRIDLLFPEDKLIDQEFHLPLDKLSRRMLRDDEMSVRFKNELRQRGIKPEEYLTEDSLQLRELQNETETEDDGT